MPEKQPGLGTRNQIISLTVSLPYTERLLWESGKQYDETH
jgi:hypothetical protein